MNVTAKDAAGATITFSADLIGGILIPKNKMTFGADGTATDVSAANGLPVAPATGAAWVLGAGSAAIGSVSVTASALPTGAATEATLAAVLKEGTDITGATMPSGGASGRGWLSAIWKAITDRLPGALVGGRLDVNVGASVLPTGAATAAKQPALGTAGTAATDVITVQGIASGTAQAISAAALPLPTGAATEASLVNIANTISSAGIGGTTALTVQGSAANSGAFPVINALFVTMSTDYAFNGGLSVVQHGTWNMGQSGTWTVQPGNTANTTPWLVSEVPATSGGCSMTKLISAATTNATSLKASAGQVYGIQVFNSNAAQRFLKLYNKASAPTVGTDVPVKTIPIPGNTAEAGCVIAFPLGVAFGTGIAYALTTGAADNDTGTVAAGEIVVNIDYK